MESDATWQTCLLLFALLPEAITETMLAPLTPFIIRMLSTDLPIEQRDAEVGKRAGDLGLYGSLSDQTTDVVFLGLLTGVFYLPLLVMNIVWGAMSDSMGRKPILLLGLLFGGLSTFTLGVNKTSFTVALLCRFLAGVFGGNSTVAKGALGEIHSTEKGRSWAYSLYGSLYAVSGICGPLIGGLLVKYSDSLRFSDSLELSPYFNIGLFGASLSIVALVTTAIYVKETPKRHVEEIVPISREPDASTSSDTPPSPPPKKELFIVTALKSSKLMISILLYVIMAFCNMSWATLFPLLFSSPIHAGGLGFAPLDVSFAMTIPAISKLLFQTLFCQRIVSRLGPNRSYCLGMAVILPATYGLGILGGTSGEYTWPAVIVCLASIGFVEAIVYLSIMMQISESVPSTSLGAAFGLSSTCAAVVRTLAPPLSGHAWEFAATGMKVPWMAFGIIQSAAALAVLLALLTRRSAAKAKSE
ncbi:hypothetical protein HDU98_005610 [Podochytrium sp. JEL0797]|nr:hypothetical protein HDU98_005610 [Podochytrium sp. JEL0797]